MKDNTATMRVDNNGLQSSSNAVIGKNEDRHMEEVARFLYSLYVKSKHLKSSQK